MSKGSMKIEGNKILKISENGISRRSPDISGSSKEVIIVGAGVAGSALAYALGKDGWHVRVIERDLTEPDRIVGEFLQPGGYLKLIELGLEDCVKGIDAQAAFGLTFHKDGKSVKLPYHLESPQSDVAARCFHNGRFVQSMREKAASLPNVRLEQGTVTSLLEENGTIMGVQYKTKTGHELTAYAALTVVCNGCFSNLRRSLSNSKVDIPSYSVGLVLENCDFPQYANYGNIILTDTNILVYPISSNEIRCLIDVPAQKFPSISNGGIARYLETEVAPKIPPELRDAFVSAINKGKLRAMPNRIMPESPCTIPGAFLIGDAFNMRHSFTGGGMTVALFDIVILRDLFRRLHDLSDTDVLYKYLKSFYTLRKPMASILNTSAAAFYLMLSESPDPLQKELRQMCFDFLSLGSSFSNGFINLISGLNPSPFSLVFHFLAFTVYVVSHCLLPFPSLKGLRIGVKSILGASVISFLMTKIEVEQILLPLTLPAY